MNISAIIKKQTGFGLLQIAILLTIIGGLASFMIKPLAPQTPTKSNEQALQKADKLLQDFIAINGRLPCTDTTGDGVEDCAAEAAKGGLPYVTLGMASRGFVAGDSPIKYGVYRNSNTTAVKNGGIDRVATSDANAVSLLSNDADLAQLKNRYQPTMAGGYSFNFTDATNQNGLDFCQSLIVAESTALDTSKLYVQTSSGAQKNVAYALSMGGRFDGNNDGALDDGLNASSSTAFNSSGTFLTSLYDDYVISRSFSELKQNMQCDVVMQSLNMVANSVLMEKEVKDQAEDMADAALEGAIMAGVNVAVIAYSVVLAAVDLANAIQTTSVASGLLSGAIASCAVLVGCAFIPVYTASVVAGAIGIALSGVAVGAGVAAGVSQAVATGLYADIAIRANAAIPADVADTLAEPDYTSLIAELTTQYNTALAEATAARNYANQKQTEANTVKATANQKFTDLYNYANTLSDNGTGDLPNTYPTAPAYNAAKSALQNATNSYKSAIDDENLKLKDYRDKLQITAGYQEDCDNTSCVFDPPLTQADIDAIPPGGDLPPCPGGGSVDASAQACIDYAVAKLASDNAYTAYLASKITSENAYTTAYQAAENHPVYVPEVKDSAGNVTSVATTVTCISESCGLPSDVSYAMGEIAVYHTYGFEQYFVFPTGNQYYSDTLINSYLDAVLERQSIADSAEIEALSREASLADLKNSLDAMVCKQAGKYWDESGLTCLDSPPPGTASSGISLIQGGENILKEADKQGVLR
ncbi:hypothetical protein [Thiomicrorhabdus lithotrophica]|uniref:Uncharacterized protein n=1 Tax=Thiomicrorhabdus lithotrophica TaxID=2949997 RepID=A0ABY8C952_9GAMM|nr:hypothetical protein [Thiomicrorhabdus lithotrophica]WEJ62499.1 hypothetical protein NR989_10850 [Thiomicrorhabdus lithotrophica]